MIHIHKGQIESAKETLKTQAGTKFPAVFDLGLGMLTSYIESDFDGAATHQELSEKIDKYIAILSETFTFINSLRQALEEKKEEIAASQT